MEPRIQYEDCVESHDRLKGNYIRFFDAPRGDKDNNFLPDKGLKPIKGDQRYLLRYKFLIYMWGATWSGSLKHLLASGAVVLLPRHNPHETYTTRKMEACPDCFLYYDPEDVCNSVIQVIESKTDADLEAHASRLHTFVLRELSIDVLLIDMYKIMEDLPLPFPSPSLVLHQEDSDGNSKLTIGGMVLMKMDCAQIKLSHRKRLKALAKAQGLKEGMSAAWQIDEVFDDNCNIQKDIEYLRYLPLL